MLFYFDFKTWLAMIRLVAKEPKSRHRTGLYKLLLWRIPVRAVFHSICFFLDGILFPKLWLVKVKEPVFIIGHARSGTTLAHRLMGADERFSTFKYYELILPSLLQKKVVRLIAKLDSSILGRRLERRLQAWEKRKFGPTQHIHKMGLTIPEEDDLIYFNSCASGFWATKLPYMDSLDFFHIDQRPAASRRRLMDFYRSCVRRQLYLNGDNRVHLSKNPTYCGRVESLLEAFPDARIVLLYRNPYETIPSLLKLLHVSWKLQGNQSAESIQKSTRAMINLSYESYLQPLEVLRRHPETPCAIIDYRTLTTAPKAAMEQAYVDLGLPLSDDFMRFLTTEQNKTRKHETTHTYSLAEFGLADSEIHDRLAPLFERFNWDAQQPSPQQEKELNHV
ncbi:sulfotransferase family protein [Pseudomonas saliphila]|uniref:sulfotransferase family protein n=1 Tax=Pseudomonas saliphila TaxID=2586906 RepID=UPI00123C6F53|nr:sulfotransferase [Pseudomonas saliphila]